MHPSHAGVAKWYTQLTQNQPVETPWGFESPRRHHVGASFVSLAPTFFQKVRVRSRRCSSFPNRTRFAGFRFGGASAGHNALILLGCRETTVSPTRCVLTSQNTSRPKVPMRKLSPSRSIKTEAHVPGFDEIAARFLFHARWRAKVNFIDRLSRPQGLLFCYIKEITVQETRGRDVAIFAPKTRKSVLNAQNSTDRARRIYRLFTFCYNLFAYHDVPPPAAGGAPQQEK